MLDPKSKAIPNPVDLWAHPEAIHDLPREVVERRTSCMNTVLEIMRMVAAQDCNPECVATASLTLDRWELLGWIPPAPAVASSMKLNPQTTPYKP
jgi:hypothetical protein